MKRLAIFDMDGTLADTSPGIVNSVKYAQRKMSLPEIPYEKMLSHVGPPMEESYARNFGLFGERLKEAVRYHKEYAMSQGYRELKVYDGIMELLRDLRLNGIHTAVATLKAQETAEKILREFNLETLFDIVIGTDLNQPMKKSGMLCECMDRFSCKKIEAVLIGDSIYDEKSAGEAGIDFIAVTYGFGFRPELKVEECRCVCICNTVGEIAEYFSVCEAKKFDKYSKKNR